MTTNAVNGKVYVLCNYLTVLLMKSEKWIKDNACTVQFCSNHQSLYYHTLQ